MPSTPGGLPYPAATEAVKDGAAAIQALAVALVAPATPILSVDLAAVAASIDTQALLGGPLPTHFRHLRAVVDARSDVAANQSTLRAHFNGDVAANYDYQYVVGDAVAGAVQAGLAAFGFLGQITGAAAPASHFGHIEALFLNYRAGYFKGYHSRSYVKHDVAATAQRLDIPSGQWRNVAAITRIVFSPAAGNFVAGTRLTLYGEL